jgi:hypothetical protein
MARTSFGMVALRFFFEKKGKKSKFFERTSVGLISLNCE